MSSPNLPFEKLNAHQILGLVIVLFFLIGVILGGGFMVSEVKVPPKLKSYTKTTETFSEGGSISGSGTVETEAWRYQ